MAGWNFEKVEIIGQKIVKLEWDIGNINITKIYLEDGITLIPETDSDFPGWSWIEICPKNYVPQV